jgi:hypothetical protein
MRIGIVNATTLAREDRLDAKHYLGSAEDDARVTVARENVRSAIRRYRKAQAAARERVAHQARLASEVGP